MKVLNFIINIVYGCIIGIANIIPGVSGGTMAVMLNIYDKLISSFTGLRKHFKESILFLLPVALGAGVGILGFAKLITWLIDNCPLPTCVFFIGLILGSLPLVFRKALATKFRVISLIPMIIAIAGMTALAFVQKGKGGDTMTLDLVNALFLFGGSAVAAMGMIIPGVSGSMLMMVFGLYSTVIGAISGLTRDFGNSCLLLLPVAAGVILGIVAGAKLIDLSLKHFPQMSYFAIIGLMIGSPLVIYLNIQSESSSYIVFNSANIIISSVVFILGIAIAVIFGSEKLRARFEKKNQTKKAKHLKK